jgi:hypothetical protein
MCWTDQPQESDPTLFLVQEGRLYLAERYKAPQHLALNGTEERPWRPFRSRDPEAYR